MKQHPLRHILVSAFLTSFLLAQHTFALDGYKCVVKDATQLKDDGTQSEAKDVLVTIGDEFVVDKVTGRMIGRLSNHSMNRQPKVIDFGSDDQAFKALTIFEPYVTVNYLYIEEYAQSFQKPFFFVEYQRYITGLCEPF